MSLGQLVTFSKKIPKYKTLSRVGKNREKITWVKVLKPISNPNQKFQKRSVRCVVNVGILAREFLRG